MTSSEPASVPRVAVVGCGYWGKNLARDFAKLGSLEAIVDEDAKTAEEIANSYETNVASLQEVLGNPAIDGVVVSLPAALHAEVARQALEAGKHVFVEKPLALNPADGEMLVELARAKRRKLMVGHLLHYHPAFTELKRLVEQGRIGRLRYVYSNRLSFGIIRRAEDALWSLAPHDISMILSLVGEEPEELTCEGTFALHPTIADAALIQFAFGSGVKGHVYCSWLHPFKEHRLVVIGDDGALVFEDSQPRREDKLKLYSNTVEWIDGRPRALKGQGESVAFDDGNPLVNECLHFLQAIAEDTRPRTDGEEGLRVLSVLDRATQSMARPAARTTASKKRFPDVWIHESAYVDADVEIGCQTRIWHFSHIINGSRIGSKVSIGQNVVVGPKVTIGDGSKIQNNVSLYEGVHLEENVFCGPSCVFTNVVNPRSEIVRKNEIMKTRVGRGATIGANATIVCGHDIGQYAFIAAGAVVTKEVVPFALMAGVPARRVGWMSRAGARLDETLICPLTGVRYRQIDDDTLEEIAE